MAREPRRRLRRPRGRRAVPRFRGLTLNRLLPNILTTLALCAGLTGIRYAVHERWELAVMSVFAAAILDGLDGRVARLLQGSSKFGAELDSLADIVSFGVSPAIILYLWTMQDAGNLGWIAVLFFAVCAALRLARFNVGIGDTALPPFAYNYFVGVPTPAAAILVLLPLMISFQVETEGWLRPWVVGAWIVLIASLQVSRIPTFSMKGIRIPQDWIVAVLIGVGVVAAFFITLPWPTLVVAGVAYLCSIVVSVRRYAFLTRAAARLRESQPEDIPDQAAAP
jgi:CDP-diacylglycerol--serine O-phosphatidyltransferase